MIPADPRLCLVFGAVEELLRNGEDVNPVTVANELLKRGKLQEAGGLAYIVTGAWEKTVKETIQ